MNDMNQHSTYPDAPPPPPPANHTAVPMVAVPAGYKLEPIGTPEDDTEKYWLLTVIGTFTCWFFSLFGLIGLCIIEKPRQKKFYGIGCAIGLALFMITWIILYVTVFAVWGRYAAAAASIAASAASVTNSTSNIGA